MSSIYGNTTRLTGLASGMDTDSIIKNLMAIEQTKVNRELRARTLIQWRQESLNSVANDFKTFRDTYMSALGSKNMLNSNNYVRFNAKTTDTSGAVTVSANANNTASRVTIDGIARLASAASATSKTDADTGKGNVLEGDLPEGNYIALGDMKFTNALNFDSSGNIQFAINGKDFTFNKSDTLQTVLSKVSNDEEAGVVLNFSRLTNTFSITAKTTGADSEVKISSGSSNVFGEDGAFQIGGDQMKAGQNAILSINGVVVEKSSNNFTIDGIQYTLNKTTGATYEKVGEGEDSKWVFDAGSADPIEYTFEKDVQGAVDKIKEFVEGYNTMVRKLEQMVHERKTNKEKSYTPLTDEEKASMTEDQIKEWETIAKKGLLNNDSGINSVLNQLRGALYETVEGVGLSPAQIGLKTGSYFDGKLGEIELDEDMLKSALEKDADQVMRMFMNISESQDPSKASKESGFIYKVQNILNTYTKETQAITLDGIGRSLREYDDRISRLETKMAEMEEKYYLKFAAMEQAMAELQNQTSSLVSMLGQG